MDSDGLSKVDTTKSSEASKVPRKSIDVTPERDKGVLKEILSQGTGDGHPLNGDTVYLHYSGRLLDGTEFDTSRRGNAKFQFVLDSEDGKLCHLLCMSYIELIHSIVIYPHLI